MDERARCRVLARRDGVSPRLMRRQMKQHVADSAGRLRNPQLFSRDLDVKSVSCAWHGDRNRSAPRPKEVPMLTKMKVALALCGSILVGGVGLAAAQGFGG